MKNLTWTFFFLMFWVSNVEAQSEKTDFDLLVQKVSNKQELVHKKKSGVYGLYKNVFSEQILNDCIYDRSCSGFSRDVFRHFGPLKGLMLTADRLTRCNRATHTQVSKFMLDKDGRALDHWDYYVK